MSVLCGAGDCTKPAVVALRFHAMPGHVHNCAEDEAINREYSDVSASAAIVDGACPWPCTAAPIYTATPRALS